MGADLGALKVGIVGKYRADGTLTTALTGGLHWLLGPQNPTYPYATYQFITNENELTFVETSEFTLVQFSIYDRDLSNPKNTDVIDAVFNKLTTTFDRAALTVAGNNFISMVRGIDRSLMIEDSTHQHTVDYTTRIQKDR